MKISDTVVGAGFVAAGALIFAGTLHYPSLEGGHPGPSLFPRILAGLMAAFGGLLSVQGLRARDVTEEVAWLRLHRNAAFINAMVVLAGVLAYIFLVERLGFLLMGALVIFAVMWRLQVPPPGGRPWWRSSSTPWSISSLPRFCACRSPWASSGGDGMIESIQAAAIMLTSWKLLLTIALCSIFGLFVGAVPGLTATMAAALLVPFTFFMEPLAALVSIVTMSAMAIFAGDIPAALVRIPGTPSSAAYTDDSYELTKQGKAELVLGVDVITSAIGGLMGAAILMTSAPLLAEVALRFTSFEYFWLAALGLSATVMIAGSSPLKAGLALLAMFCIVGSFAINNSLFDVGVMLAMGILGYFFEANGIPVAPIVLGMVLGPIVEQNFMVSMIKTQWDLTQFFTRPTAAILAVLTILIWLVPLLPILFRRSGRTAPAP